MDPDEKPLLEQLQEKRAALAAKVEPLIEKREEEHKEFDTRTADEDEARRPTDDERTAFADAETRFDAEVAELAKEINALDLRIERQELVKRGEENAAKASRGDITVTSEPEVYKRSGEKDSPSYFVDLACRAHPALASKMGPRADGYAKRLEEHSKLVEDVMPKREQQRARRAEAQVENAERETRGRWLGRSAGFEESPFERRAPSRIPGQGGYGIPPLWLIDDYIPYLRPGRVAAGLPRQMTLPSGTDSINVPKLTTPTAVAVQTADNAPVATQDIKDNFVQANVKTLAGFADLPLQLIEQSPGTIIDEVITRDMMGAYDVALDKQVISGNGTGAPLSGGQIVGIYPSSNWEATSLTWTAASPTGQGFFQMLGAMASKTAQARFNLQDFAFLVHPRRWFWGSTYTDSNGRFIVENQDFGPFNTDALIIGEQTPFEGLVGRVPFGPKVYIDANMPTNDAGHKTAEVADADVAIGAIWDDLWLFEGDIRTDVFDQTLSGTMEIRYRLYNYVALLQRYGPSVAISTGTGFAPPATVDGTLY
jgi:HK97 family phage major capsid protein